MASRKVTSKKIQKELNEMKEKVKLLELEKRNIEFKDKYGRDMKSFKIVKTMTAILSEDQIFGDREYREDYGGPLNPTIDDVWATYNDDSYDIMELVFDQDDGDNVTITKV